MRASIRAVLLALALCVGAGPASAAGLTDQAIEAAVASAVRDRARFGDDVQVEVTDVRVSNEALARRASGVERAEIPPRETPHGMVTLRLHLDVPGQTDAWTWARARVQATVPAVVAVRSLPRGHVIRAADVRVARAPHTVGAPRVVDEVVGRRLNRAMRAEQPLQRRVLDDVQAVSRGDRVEVVVVGPGLRVRSAGEVLDAGAVGDRVRVRVDATGRVVHGRVTGPERVEVSS